MFQFDSFSDFIHMGGHGQYVWIAYFASLGIMVWLFFSPLLRKKNIIKKINKQNHCDPIK